MKFVMGVNLRTNSDIFLLKKIFFVAVFILAAYFSWLGTFGDYIRANFPEWLIVKKLSADGGDWGAFGDFLGGVLNPVIAGFTLWKVIESGREQACFLKKAANSAEQSASAQTDILGLHKINLELQSDNLKLQAALCEANERLVKISSVAFLSKSSYAGYVAKLELANELQLKVVDENGLQFDRINAILDPLEKDVEIMKNQILHYEKIVIEILESEKKEEK